MEGFSWQSYAEEVTEVNKRAGEDPKYVNALVRSRTEMIAQRDNLDLAKPADLVAAQEKARAENPDLFKRYIAANTINVGKVSLITAMNESKCDLAFDMSVRAAWRCGRGM